MLSWPAAGGAQRSLPGVAGITPKYADWSRPVCRQHKLGTRRKFLV